MNEDANGMIYVSKRPMNQNTYFTPARIYCVVPKKPLTEKDITRKGVFAGAVCETIDGDILKIVKVKNRKGCERKYIREGVLKLKVLSMYNGISAPKALNKKNI